jgi:hypothetical protein
MAKERIGTVEYDPRKGCYRVRLTLNDGARPWVDLTPTARSPLAEARAREVAAERSRIAREENLTAADFGLKSRVAAELPAPATGAGDMETWLAAWAVVGCGQNGRIGRSADGAWRARRRSWLDADQVSM